MGSDRYGTDRIKYDVAKDMTVDNTAKYIKKKSKLKIKNIYIERERERERERAQVQL